MAPPGTPFLAAIALFLVVFSDVASVTILYVTSNVDDSPLLPAFHLPVVGIELPLPSSDCIVLCYLRALSAVAVGLWGLSPLPSHHCPPSVALQPKSYCTIDAPQVDETALQLLHQSAHYLRLQMWQGWVLRSLHLFSWGCSLYIAITAISFEYTQPVIQMGCMTHLVLICYLEGFLVAHCLSRAKQHISIQVPTLHPHGLILHPDEGYKCNVCNRRSRAHRFVCCACEFQCCWSCFMKHWMHEGSPAASRSRTHQPLGIWDYIIKWCSLLRPFSGWVTILVCSLIIYQVTKLALPNYQGSIVDSIINGDRKEVINNLQLYVFFTALTAVFTGLRQLSVGVVTRRVNTSLREILFRKFLVQDLAFYDHFTTGELTARMTNDVNAMVEPLRTVINGLFSNVLLLVGGLGMCLLTSWKLSLVLLTAAGPILYITSFYSCWANRVNRQILDALADANAVSTEALCCIRTVRAFACEAFEARKFANHIDRVLYKGLQDAWALAATALATSGLDLGAGLVFMAYGGLLLVDGKSGMTLGELVTFQLYANMLSNAYQGLTSTLGAYTRTCGASQRLFTLLHSMTEADWDKGVCPPIAGESLHFQCVTFRYPSRPDSRALRDLTLTIPAGKVTAIMGKSGAGKTTLIQLLMGFYQPSEGHIFVGDHDLRGVSLGWLRQHIGLVTQETQLLEGTITENIAYGAQDYTQAQVQAAAELANAHHFITQFPAGYHTIVGERGALLSAGQRQRLAIARALFRQPALLLLDEATSALDTEAEALVQDALDSLVKTSRETSTIVLVAHRLSTVMHADHIVVLDGGQVAEEGNHQTLLDRGGLYAKIVQRQSAAERNKVLPN